jgi:hypothetical protein
MLRPPRLASLRTLRQCHLLSSECSSTIPECANLRRRRPKWIVCRLRRLSWLSVRRRRLNRLPSYVCLVTKRFRLQRSQFFLRNLSAGLAHRAELEMLRLVGDQRDKKKREPLPHRRKAKAIRVAAVSAGGVATQSVIGRRPPTPAVDNHRTYVISEAVPFHGSVLADFLPISPQSASSRFRVSITHGSRSRPARGTTPTQNSTVSEAASASLPSDETFATTNGPIAAITRPVL